MNIDFRNTNTLWASILAETLKRLGLTTAVICPGSRSTPLTVAFAQHSGIEAIPILDERSAAFFALGIAKKSGFPVVLICTSGTAGANFYPAVIEAKESRVPLLIFTADRPPELRDCHSGQTINQVKLYGDYPNWQTELALPVGEMEILVYLRQTIVQAVRQTLFPVNGPVHLNIPFRDPLAPIEERIKTFYKTSLHFNSEEFFSAITPHNPNFVPQTYQPVFLIPESNQGIIIAGGAQPLKAKEYCQAIAYLAQYLGFPVLAEGLSPLRNYADINPYLISTYNLILRNEKLANKLTPEFVIQFGQFPTSKILRNWLTNTKAKHFIIDPSGENFDPLHNKTIHLNLHPEQLIDPYLKEYFKRDRSNNLPSPYLNLWLKAETQVKEVINQKMSDTEELFEGKVAWLLPKTLPAQTPVFVANSMPVRDVEYFWFPNNRHLQTFFNRGANGIDGTLSTALGIAHHNQSSILLTGDLALLHDTNGFLQRDKFFGHLTIILINNNGGGIFHMLPIANYEPPFEEFFATPQNINFSQFCATYNIDHQIVNSWPELKSLLNPLPKTGIRVLELPTSRHKDSDLRKEYLNSFADNY